MFVPATSYGRAYGFERAMDNLGAIDGPLLALGLVAIVGTRTAILLSVIPGLLAALAILYAISATKRPTEQDRPPLHFHHAPSFRDDSDGSSWESRHSRSGTSPQRYSACARPNF
jgi:hypothetical protein